ncbi:hypothetical protein [Kordiimonas aquimaris]|uniref:hypothetical protein n=1 Tax=Kordiimonas aquimaris TaxID=707591 RepID=UPI0021D19364|nr:hypothetical protein [Kordiimonas aquimaris]
MSTPPKAPKTTISYAHKNRNNLPGANRETGLSKTHVRSDFYVASNPERVRQQREEQIAKQIKAQQLFRPSPHMAYGPGIAPSKRPPTKHKRPHIPPEELVGIRKRMEAFKQARLKNEAAQAQTQQKTQAKPAPQNTSDNLEKMKRKAVFIAQRTAPSIGKTKTHKR